jgi:hypothetical protein
VAQRKFLDFLDMIDGGGAGKMGDSFEGGGLLSLLGNEFATPYGSEDKDRRARRMAAHGLLDKAAPAGAGTRPRSAPPASPLRPQGRPQIKTDLDPFGGAGPNIAGAAAERGMGLDPFGGAGPDIAGAAAERGMGLDPFGGDGFNPANAAPVQVSSPSVDQNPNYSAPKDPYIAQIPPTNLPNAPQQSALPDMTPSIGEFVEFLNRHYDPAFVRRVTLDSDRFEDAYRLFVNNGGKLTP